jgi:hypothetical protein
VVTSIQRHHADVPLQPQPLRGLAALHAAGLEWWNWNACPLLIGGLHRLQRQAWYRHAATMWLDRTQRQRRFIVRVPLSAHQSHDLCREFPADQFVPEQPLWQSNPALRWILSLHFNDEQTPAGTVTLVWHPADCPKGSGWRIGEPQVRTLYRGAGLEDALFLQAQRILARSGMILNGIAG